MNKTLKRPYENLIVWQESHKLCLATCKIIRDFPKEERFGLIDQMRRSSQSIPTNIVEGNARKTIKDKRNFFTIAKASLEELHYQYLLARDLGYLSFDLYESVHGQIAQVSYLLNKFYSSQPASFKSFKSS